MPEMAVDEEGIREGESMEEETRVRKKYGAGSKKGKASAAKIVISFLVVLVILAGAAFGLRNSYFKSHYSYCIIFNGIPAFRMTEADV